VVSFLANASQVVLFLLGVFLIIVILLQRGRGGGLAGAFGGMGGQSAFGTKAGDVFTRITIVLAICWVILAGGSGYLLRAASKGQAGEQFGAGAPETSNDESAETDASATTSGESDAPTGRRTEAPAAGVTTPAPSGGTPESSGAAPAASSSSGDTTKPPQDPLPADTTAPESTTPGQPTPTPQDK
jgi:preprotein translocase subunit SecG